MLNRMATKKYPSNATKGIAKNEINEKPNTCDIERVQAKAHFIFC